ncbi:hypothetical protein WA158_006220 [Blastocystis sp. Blastoise]
MDVLSEVDDAIVNLEVSIKKISSCFFSFFSPENLEGRSVPNNIRDTVNKYIDTQIEVLNKKKYIAEQFTNQLECMVSTLISDFDGCETDELSKLQNQVNTELYSLINICGKKSFLNKSSFLKEKIRVPSFVTKNSNHNRIIEEPLLRKYHGCLLSEKYADSNSLNENGDVYIDHEDVYFNILIKYMNEECIDYDSFSQLKKNMLIEQFEYFKMPFRKELFDLARNENEYKKIYSWNNNRILVVNGKDDLVLSNYLKKNNLIDKLFKNVKIEDLIYNEEEQSIRYNIQLQYQSYIDEYIQNNTILFKQPINHLNSQSILSEFNYLSIPLSSPLYYIIPSFYFSDSIIVSKEYDSYFNEWFQNIQQNSTKKWNLLYRASEHDFTSSSFHEYCDNCEYLFIIIKCINNHNNTCIFGGYTQLGFIHPYHEMNDDYKIYDFDAFIYTLKNPYNTKPLQFKHKNCESLYYNTSFGPSFNQIFSLCNQGNMNINNIIYPLESITNPIFEYNSIYEHSIFINNDLKDINQYFKISEYEVYSYK